MQQRSNSYINDRRQKVSLEGADGQMVFRMMSHADLVRNARAQLCVVVDEDDLRLPNEMVLCYYIKPENQIFYIDKWQLYYRHKDLINNGKKFFKILVPLKEFKVLKNMPWAEEDCSNVTWQAIQPDVMRDIMPANFEDQIPLFTYAAEEAKRGK